MLADLLRERVERRGQVELRFERLPKFVRLKIACVNFGRCRFWRRGRPIGIRRWRWWRRSSCRCLGGYDRTLPRLYDGALSSWCPRDRALPKRLRVDPEAAPSIRRLWRCEKALDEGVEHRVDLVLDLTCRAVDSDVALILEQRHMLSQVLLSDATALVSAPPLQKLEHCSGRKTIRRLLQREHKSRLELWCLAQSAKGRAQRLALLGNRNASVERGHLSNARFRLAIQARLFLLDALAVIKESPQQRSQLAQLQSPTLVLVERVKPA